MPFELEKTAGGATLILSGKLNVEQARPLWDALQPTVAAKKAIRLQAEALEAMDTSIVQILCRLSGQLHIGGISDGFLTSLKLRGLEQFFLSRSQEAGAKLPVSKQRPATRTKSRDGRRTHGKTNTRSR